MLILSLSKICNGNCHGMSWPLTISWWCCSTCTTCQTSRRCTTWATHWTLIALAALGDQQEHIGMLRSACLLSPIAFLNKVSSPLALGAADLFMAEALYLITKNRFLHWLYYFKSQTTMSLIQTIFFKSELSIWPTRCNMEYTASKQQKKALEKRVRRWDGGPALAPWTYH